MKDLYQVLREKEIDIVRVRREIEALLLVIPLLLDGEDQSADVAEVPLSHRNKWPLELEATSTAVVLAASVGLVLSALPVATKPVS